jgi:hypothetical protein
VIGEDASAAAPGSSRALTEVAVDLGSKARPGSSASATSTSAIEGGEPKSSTDARELAPRPLPTRRTVLLARGASSGKAGKAAPGAAVRERSARGIGGASVAARSSQSERAASAAERALGAMKAVGTGADERARLGEADGGDHDASGSAQLSEAHGVESMRRADEREKLAAK